jgi:hypothetical protein
LTRALLVALLAFAAACGVAMLAARFVGRWAWGGLLPVVGLFAWWGWQLAFGPNDSWQALGAFVALIFLALPLAIGWVAGALLGLRWRGKALSR